MRNKLLMHLMRQHKTIRALILNLLKDSSALLLISFQMSFGINQPKLMTHTIKHIDELTQEITIAFTVDQKDCIYKDFITVSSYEPTVTVSTWKTNKLPVAHYDPLFKDTKQIFDEDFTLCLTATAQQTNTEPLYVYCSYYRRSDKKINQLLIPLLFAVDEAINEQCIETNIDAVTTDTVQKNNTPLHHSPIDNYYDTILFTAHTIIQSFRTDHKNYFLLFIILIIMLLIVSHLLKEQLKTHITLKEVLEITIALLSSLVAIYGLFYVNSMSRPLITISLACASASGAGFFYTKKSTNLQSGYLRTLCTIIGTLCICSAIFLLFKLLRYL